MQGILKRWKALDSSTVVGMQLEYKDEIKNINENIRINFSSI